MLGVVLSLQGVSFGEIRSFSLAFLAPGAQIRCKQFSFFISRFQSCNIICFRIVISCPIVTQSAISFVVFTVSDVLAAQPESVERLKVFKTVYHSG